MTTTDVDMQVAAAPVLVSPVPHARASATSLFRHPLVILSFISLFGLFTRFAFLDSPPAWGNEAKTYQKICGTFDEMLEMLENQGFPPLHYATLWWVKEKFGSSITTLRIFPAICGALTVPAMYFLARQFASQRVALLAALFTACSAWMIHYSRDSKMYAPLWFFLTLNVACFLWWARTGLSTAWLGWVAAGLAMVGMQALGFIVLLIQPMWLLTSRRCHWKQGVWFVLGLALICAGPAGYYANNNRWQGTGLEWVERRNSGIPAMELIGDTTSAFFFNYTWIEDHPTAVTPPIVLKACFASLAVLAVLLALGSFPWRKSAADEETTVEPSWRRRLWLGLWICIPVYGFYLASLPQTQSPADWGKLLPAALGRWWWVWPIGSIVFAAACFAHRWIGRGLAIALGGTAFVLLVYALFKAGVTNPPAGIGLWLSLLGKTWFLWFAAIVLPAIAWFHADITLRGRMLRMTQLVVVSMGVVGLMWVLHRVNSIVRNPLQDSLWMPRYLGVVWPAAAIVAAGLLLRLPTRALRYSAIVALLGVNLLQAYAYVFISSEPPIDRVAREVLEMRQANSRVFVYTPPTERPRGSPSGGQIASMIGKMYLLQYSGEPTGPRAFNQTNVAGQFGLRTDDRPTTIARDVQQHASVNRVIVWQKLDPAAVPGDPILDALGNKWSLRSETLYPVRTSWSWGWVYDYRRREYVRSEQN